MSFLESKYEWENRYKGGPSVNRTSPCFKNHKSWGLVGSKRLWDQEFNPQHPLVPATHLYRLLCVCTVNRKPSFTSSGCLRSTPRSPLRVQVCSPARSAGSGSASRCRQGVCTASRRASPSTSGTRLPRTCLHTPRKPCAIRSLFLFVWLGGEARRW